MTFLEALKNNSPLILDAAMGTDICSRGFSTSLPLWSAWVLLENPQLIYQIHRDNLEAGAQILTTNTFRTQAHVLSKVQSSERCEPLTQLAVALAQQAKKDAKQKCWIFGSLAPLEDCYHPEQTPSWSICLREHRRHATALAQAGVDGFILETFSHRQEIEAVFQAAREFELPIILSLACTGENQTLAGEKLDHFIPFLEHEVGPPDVWGLNCLTPREITRVHKKLVALTDQPTAVWAHVGHHDEDIWKESGLMEPKEYAKEAQQWIQNGATIVGGCCGTNAEFIREIAQLKV